MKIIVELEVEIVTTFENDNSHDATDKLILEAVSQKIGTNISNMYIDDAKINKLTIN